MYRQSPVKLPDIKRVICMFGGKNLHFWIWIRAPEFNFLNQNLSIIWLFIPIVNYLPSNTAYFGLGLICPQIDHQQISRLDPNLPILELHSNQLRENQIFPFNKCFLFEMALWTFFFQPKFSHGKMSILIFGKHKHNSKIKRFWEVYCTF